MCRWDNKFTKLPTFPIILKGVHDLLVEVMEDIAMVRAIQDGENSGPASRDDIFQILEGKEGSA